MCIHHAQYPESCAGKAAKSRESVRSSCSIFGVFVFRFMNIYWLLFLSVCLGLVWVFFSLYLNVCMCICTSSPLAAQFLYTLAVFCSRLLVLSSTQTFANSSGVYFYLSSLSFVSFQTFFCFVCYFVSYGLHHAAIGRGWIYWTVAPHGF